MTNGTLLYCFDDFSPVFQRDMKGDSVIRRKAMKTLIKLCYMRSTSLDTTCLMEWKDRTHQ